LKNYFAKAYVIYCEIDSNLEALVLKSDPLLENFNCTGTRLFLNSLTIFRIPYFKWCYSRSRLHNRALCRYNYRSCDIFVKKTSLVSTVSKFFQR